MHASMHPLSCNSIAEHIVEKSKWLRTIWSKCGSRGSTSSKTGVWSTLRSRRATSSRRKAGRCISIGSRPPLLRIRMIHSCTRTRGDFFLNHELEIRLPEATSAMGKPPHLPLQLLVAGWMGGWVPNCNIPKIRPNKLLAKNIFFFKDFHRRARIFSDDSSP